MRNPNYIRAAAWDLFNRLIAAGREPYYVSGFVYPAIRTNRAGEHINVTPSGIYGYAYGRRVFAAAFRQSGCLELRNA